MPPHIYEQDVPASPPSLALEAQLDEHRHAYDPGMPLFAPAHEHVQPPAYEQEAGAGQSTVGMGGMVGQLPTPPSSPPPPVVVPVSLRDTSADASDDAGDGLDDEQATVSATSTDDVVVRVMLPPPARSQESIGPRSVVEIVPGVTADPQIAFGKPVIATTRVPVALVLGQLAAGVAVAELCTWTPRTSALWGGSHALDGRGRAHGS
jgi:hypothetical protein